MTITLSTSISLPLYIYTYRNSLRGFLAVFKKKKN